MILSNKAQQQILRQQMHAMFPYLIKITNDDFGVFFYVNADNDITWNDEVYTACCFSVKPPDKSESKIGTGTLIFSGIYNNGEWIKKIRQTENFGKIEVAAFIEYKDGNINGIEKIYDSEYSVTNVEWNNENGEISISFKFDDGMDIVIPCDTLDEIVCPGVA